jgi:hypothetical protein
MMKRMWGHEKKAKVSGLEEDDSDIDSDKTSLNEGPKRKKTCVFSQASEDAQDTCEKTEVQAMWMTWRTSVHEKAIQQVKGNPMRRSRLPKMHR